MIHTDRQWFVENAVGMIGRHQEAVIRLDHPDVSSRHAVVFHFANGAAIFDLGSRGGLWVNGQRCSLTLLHDGDCITVGPFGLAIGATGSPPIDFNDTPTAVSPTTNGTPVPFHDEHNRTFVAGSGSLRAGDSA